MYLLGPNPLLKRLHHLPLLLGGGWPCPTNITYKPVKLPGKVCDNSETRAVKELVLNCYVSYGKFFIQNSSMYGIFTHTWLIFMVKPSSKILQLYLYLLRRCERTP